MKHIFRTIGKVGVVLLLALPLQSRLQAEVLHYTVRPGDSLWEIAKKHRTAIPFIKRLNGLTGDTIYPGQKLKIYTGPISIVVVKSEFKLQVYGGNAVLAEYTVAIGRDGLTPSGTYTIKTKVVNPDWWDPDTGEHIKFGDPRHAIGTRWMGFGVKGLGIHGTNEPESIGRASSRGCIRMLNAEIEEMFWAVPRGTVVEIVDQPRASGEMEEGKGRK